MTDGLKDVHREAIVAILAANERVDRAVLFGSRATGTNTASSDVDIALFGVRLTLTDQARIVAALDEIPMAQSVDLVLYESITNDVLLTQIQRHGIEWYRRPSPSPGEDREEVESTGVEDWVESPFGEVIDFREGPGILARDFREDGVPLVRLAGLDRGASVLQGCDYLSPETVEHRWAHFRLQSGDVLLSTSAALGRIAVVRQEGIGAIPYTGIIRMRPRDESLCAPFIQYLLEGPDFQRQAEMLGAGSVIRHFGPTHLRQMTLPVPPLSEQRAIVHILGALDDKIELNRRMNAALEAMAQALFRSWFVDFDPVRAKMESRDTGLPKDIADLFPDRMVESEFGELPSGWSLGHVEDGFEIIMGQSPPGHTYNDTGDGLPFFQGRSDFGFRFPKRRKYCTAPNRTAQPWDTIVSVRAPVGDINMAREPCCIGRGVAALRHRSGAVSFAYCTAQALQTHMRQYEHTGTVFGAINRKQLARLPIHQPAADIVLAFEQLVHPWDQTIRLRTVEIDTLTAVRDALLPKLVSGELRVTGLDPTSVRDDRLVSIGAHGT